MITEIPTSAEYHETGVNLIYLAWQIALRAAADYEEAAELAQDMSAQEFAAAAALFWNKSQPALANAFGLVQQAMEMGLKGRIAAISPFLLLSRDPKEWPRKSETDPVPFSDFRTLDSADLIRVHNTVATKPLEAGFRSFFDSVRRERNVVMHSLPNKSYDPSTLIRHILTVVEALFSESPWPLRLLKMESEGKYAGFGVNSEADHNRIMNQTDQAIFYISPAEAIRFFDFDKRRRAYVCPTCRTNANVEWQASWPKLAQLATKKPRETILHCKLCNEIATVIRSSCTSPYCKANVIRDGECLTCLRRQNSAQDFQSGLILDSYDNDRQYYFRYYCPDDHSSDFACFADDETAIEHARRAMAAPHLLGWDSVEVSRASGLIGSRAIGRLIRGEGGLDWIAEPS